MTDKVPMIHAKMVEILRNVGAIAKGKENTFHRYKFRGIDDVYQELHGHMANAGVFMTSEILESKFETRENKKGNVDATATIVVRYWFYAEDGSCVKTEISAMGADTGDKAFNKALSAAHKYALLQAFLVPCEGLDDQCGDGFQYGQRSAQQSGKTADQQRRQQMQQQVDISCLEYNPDSPGHKAALKKIFDKLGIADQDTMKLFSKSLVGIEIKELEPKIEELRKSVPGGF